MDEVSQISEFGKILIFLIIGIILVAAMFFVVRLLAPKNPGAEKLTSYECGEEPTGNAWLPFNSRFYVIALIFLLFDVEMVFVFPWATVFGSHEIAAADNRWGLFSLAEMFIFLGILIIGLVYVWVKGDLNWIKPSPVMPTVDTNIPADLYENINRRQHILKKFTVDSESIAAAAVVADPPVATSAPTVRFKPTFKK